MLRWNKTLSVVLSPGNELEEVVVTATSTHCSTQLPRQAKYRSTAKDLNREYALQAPPRCRQGTLQTLWRSGRN